MSGIAAILTELSTSPKRKVYIVKWGRSDKTCWSFHHTLLVADNGVNKDISAYTTGVIFDWGSYVAGGIVKSDIPVKVKPFNSHEFHVGKAKKNIYKFVGWTDWDDKSTEELSMHQFKSDDIPPPW